MNTRRNGRRQFLVPISQYLKQETQIRIIHTHVPSYSLIISPKQKRKKYYEKAVTSEISFKDDENLKVKENDEL